MLISRGGTVVSSMHIFKTLLLQKMSIGQKITFKICKLLLKILFFFFSQGSLSFVYISEAPCVCMYVFQEKALYVCMYVFQEKALCLLKDQFKTIELKFRTSKRILENIRTNR